MIDPDFIELFAKYIKQDSSKETWEEKGLVDNAPASAIIAFGQYKEIMENAKRMGVEV